MTSRLESDKENRRCKLCKEMGSSLSGTLVVYDSGATYWKCKECSIPASEFCLWCKETLINRQPNAKFCCPRHRRLYNARIKNETLKIVNCMNCNKDFSIKNRSKTKFCSSACKSLHAKDYSLEYRSTPEYKAKDKARQSSADYKEKTNTRQRSDEHHLYQAEYRQKPEVRVKNLKRQRDRINSDVGHKLGCRLRARLYGALNGKIKAGSAVKDMGCTVNELKVYGESLFQPGMTWENWGNKPGTWQLDHIEELMFFDLTNREEFLKANHYTNLQPLWFKDHIIKTMSAIKRKKALKNDKS